MKIGELDVSKIYLGSAEIEKIYLGTEQVFGGEPTPVPFEEQYLTFVAEADNCTIQAVDAHSNVFQYSVDNGQTWNNLANNGSTSSVNSGQTILFKATGLTVNSGDGIGTLKPSVSASVQGNVMSLLYGDDFSGQTTITNDSQFRGLFYNCANITSAENLILPATTLVNSCYRSMFTNCTSLTIAPELPATTLANSCYYGMFRGCTSLTTAPELPATTLTDSCYYGMFSDCASLTTAPVLSATTLAEACYANMFGNCTSLNYIKCLATDISANNCKNGWVSGVASSGTFVKAASMNDWTYGGGGIPTGWVVENEGDLPYNAQYLTIESLEDNNTISFTMGTGMTTAITTAVTSVSVSTDDGVTWTSMENIGANASLSVTLDTGEKALWKGEALGYAITTGATKSTLFSSTGNYKVYGNITSLLYDDDFLNQDNPTLPDFNCFTNLFNGSTGLTDASNLIMQFTLFTTNKRPIGYLFRGCTNLIAAPELGNIDFVGSPYAFRDMFHDCTSLTTAPSLTATTLAQGCYTAMFMGCTSLTTAPELPAITLASGCYNYMFRGCTSLNYIKCLTTDISASNCTTNWVFGVAATGTFVKAASMSDWTTGSSGIPEDWTVQNDDGSPVGGGDWDE